MGEHHYGFYTGDLFECFEKIYDYSKLQRHYVKNHWAVDSKRENAALSLIYESYNGLKWQHSMVLLAEREEQSEPLMKLRDWLYCFTIDKDSFTERDIRYMQQYLSSQGCPRKDRAVLNNLIGIPRIRFGIME